MEQLTVLLWICTIQLASTQQCSYVTVPVCGDDVTITPGRVNGVKGDKGEVGMPGKLGPRGITGYKGDKGEIGAKGEIGSLEEFQEEMRKQMKDLKMLVTPASCFTSSVYGAQKLRNCEEAFCDNGWTVFQRRFDGSVDFQVGWQEYKNGFGNLTGEFWLGLEKIHLLTKGKGCRLRIDMWDFDDDHRFAEYSDFHVENETDFYRLRVAGYSGTAGDSLTDKHSLNGMAFTTYDQDHDLSGSSNCAGTVGGNHHGGFWFNNCLHASPNAQWGRTRTNWLNIIWNDWKGKNDALKAITMKLRCD